MAIDLKALSPKELQALIAGANAQMQEAHATQVRTVREKIDGLLKSAGLNLDEVYPARRSKGTKNGKKSSVAPKYRNPANPEQTWSGRGKRPLWLAGALKKRGVTLESFLIDGGTSKAAPAKKTVATKGKKATKKVVKT
ncbi:H-NS histone family protein [Rhodanobacter sp. C05]|uniref:H-NS histone family protein n=1 Tax=Rhodanobacter sp. C05 TaxID=1945855 RepID=UPI0009873138|nr:H-NS histone family protein [Rhodanobacter sp. C05]OOG41434.1 histidine biosynthesis protein [Rhodanobacter sp. C05]